MAQRASQPQLIATKSEPPALPRRETMRPRVMQSLSIASERGFILVSGPPGVGKTVAVQQWLSSESDGRRVAWLSLDPADDSPLRFWRYVVASFSHAGVADLVETLAIARETGGTGEEVAASFVNELQAIAGPVLLVIDDLHVVESPEILRQLEVVIDHLPSTFRVLAASRTDPALPLARWRAQQRLGEVRHADLAFRPDEVAEYLAAFDGLELSDADIEHIAARTEGWAAAIQLIALAARDASDPHEAVWSVTGEDMAIASFLTSELLDRQPADVRAFLLDTSILGVLDTPLCNAVTGRTDARAMLKQLEAANLFVIRLRGREQYRYHQLFAEVLGVELHGEDLDGTRRQRLHRRAAAYLGDADDVAGQVEHLLAAGDLDAAFQVAVAPAMRLWDRGEADPAALEWLDLFPATFVEADGRRIVPYLIALGAASKWERIGPWMPLAEQLCAPRDVDVIRMTLDLIAGDGGSALRVAGRVSAEASPAWSPGDLQLRSRLVPHVTRAHLLRDDVEGARHACEGASLDDPIAVGVVAPAVCARVALRLGELNRALQCADEAFTAAEELGVPQHFALLDARLARAGVHLDRNRLRDAEAELEAAFDAAEQRRAPGYQVLAHLLQARVAAARHGAADALAVIAIARRTVELRCRGDDLGHLLSALEVRMFCELGALGRARALLATLPAGPASALLAARVAVESGDGEEAVAVLEGAALSTVRDRLEAVLLCARIELARGDPAVELVERAIAIAAAEEFVRPFLDEDASIARRVQAVAASSLSQRARALAGSLAASGIEGEAPMLVESLTPRERQVLRYLPRPLTNEEIAAELFVSLNTVKTHLKGVYRKLGATSRSEVVDRARTLGLL